MAIREACLAVALVMLMIAPVSMARSAGTNTPTADPHPGPARPSYVVDEFVERYPTLHTTTIELIPFRLQAGATTAYYGQGDPNSTMSMVGDRVLPHPTVTVLTKVGNRWTVYADLPATVRNTTGEIATEIPTASFQAIVVDYALAIAPSTVVTPQDSVTYPSVSAVPSVAVPNDTRIDSTCGPCGCSGGGCGTDTIWLHHWDAPYNAYSSGLNAECGGYGASNSSGYIVIQAQAGLDSGCTDDSSEWAEVLTDANAYDPPAHPGYLLSFFMNGSGAWDVDTDCSYNTLLGLGDCSATLTFTVHEYQPSASNTYNLIVAQCSGSSCKHEGTNLDGVLTLSSSDPCSGGSLSGSCGYQVGLYGSESDAPYSCKTCAGDVGVGNHAVAAFALRAQTSS